MKHLVQCDFDGTITEEDVSFLLLDSFSLGDWHHLLEDYKKHRISVGQFNTKAFAMIKADKLTLLKAIEGKVKVRDGFHKLAAYCSKKGIRLVIVSNGLDFYVKSLLREFALENLEAYAARTRFHADGLKVQYIGPDGRRLEDGFKEAYIKSFLKEGYRVTYVGNGDSDIKPAKYADQILARDELLAYYRENNLNCISFDDLNDVVKALELLPNGD